MKFIYCLLIASSSAISRKSKSQNTPENLQFFMMNKQHPKIQDLPANDVLVQIDNNQEIHQNLKMLLVRL
jgi:hypothetical protein